MNVEPTPVESSMSDLAGKKAVVVGASRGLGRGVAEAISAAGASVVALARDRAGLEDLARADPLIEVAVADATDPVVAGTVIDSHDPDILAVIAGASPLLHPIHHHTWETFSLNWQVDVRVAFNWLREAMLKPSRPGSRVLLMSSGAALRGSPMSGGYAGAKATIRFIAAYAGGRRRGVPRAGRRRARCRSRVHADRRRPGGAPGITVSGHVPDRSRPRGSEHCVKPGKKYSPGSRCR